MSDDMLDTSIRSADLLTAEQVASMLAVTPAWVYAQSRKGRIPTVTLGRYRRYRREAIEEWLRIIETGSAAIASSQRG